MNSQPMTLQDFAIDHDYYCSTDNYNSNTVAEHYATWQDFYAEWGSYDPDYNLVFRFDVKPKDDGTYRAEIFIMQQRRGKFVPVTINLIGEEDVPALREYLQPSYDKLQAIWKPFPLA